MIRIFILYLHLIGATIWVGGHLILMLRFLPLALKNKSIDYILNFEEKFEPIGLAGLLIQVITGSYLILDWSNNYQDIFNFTNPVIKLIWIKIGMLILTVLLALDVKLRIQPNISDKKIIDMAFHIVPVTLMGMLFVLCGLLIRYGGIN